MTATRSKMKFCDNMMLRLVSGFAFCASLHAHDTQSPYALIAERNIFGIYLSPVKLTETQSITSPPQITVCGIMSVFERPQVLFNVAGTLQPGKTAMETSHILGIGQQESGITVLKIECLNNRVTFDNHGAVQTISLSSAQATWKPPDISDSVFSGPIPNRGAFAHIDYPGQIDQ